MVWLWPGSSHPRPPFPPNPDPNLHHQVPERGHQKGNKTSQTSHTLPQTPRVGPRHTAQTSSTEPKGEPSEFQLSSATSGRPWPVACSPWLAIKDPSGANFCPKHRTTVKPLLEVLMPGLQAPLKTVGSLLLHGAIETTAVAALGESCTTPAGSALREAVQPWVEGMRPGARGLGTPDPISRGPCIPPVWPQASSRAP